MWTAALLTIPTCVTYDLAPFVPSAQGLVAVSATFCFGYLLKPWVSRLRFFESSYSSMLGFALTVVLCVSFLHRVFVEHIELVEVEKILLNDLRVRVEFVATIVALVLWMNLSRRVARCSGAASTLASCAMGYALPTVAWVIASRMVDYPGFSKVIFCFGFGLAGTFIVGLALRRTNGIGFDGPAFFTGQLMFQLVLRLASGTDLWIGFWTEETRLWPIIPLFAAILGYVTWDEIKKRVFVYADVESPLPQVRCLRDDVAELLSSREAEVVKRSAHGESMSQIANQMGLAASTVSTYKARAFEKIHKRFGLSIDCELSWLLIEDETPRARIETDGEEPTGFFDCHPWLACVLFVGVVVLLFVCDWVDAFLFNSNIVPFWQVSIYVAWSVALAALYAGVLFRAHRPERELCPPLESMAPSRRDFLIGYCSLTLAIGIGARALSSDWIDYFRLASLLLVFVALGSVEDDVVLGKEAFAVRIVRSVQKGVNTFFRAMPSYLLGWGAGLSISQYIWVYASPTGEGITFLWVILCIASIWVIIDSAQSDHDAEIRRLEHQEACMGFLERQGIRGFQAEVLLEIAQGTDVESISEKLHLAVNTVTSYRYRGYKKLGVHSARELCDVLRAGALSTDKDELHP